MLNIEQFEEKLIKYLEEFGRPNLDFGYIDYAYNEDSFICYDNSVYGASGGNCWGDEAESFSRNKFDDNLLDILIDFIFYNLDTEIDYKIVKSIFNENVSFDTKEDFNNEYYGNYSYSFKYEIKYENIYFIYRIIPNSIFQ